MHFGNVLLKKFVEVVTQVGVAGLDAQFCNNSLRRPLYFLCTQDPVTFRTIPGFILLLAKNDKIHLMEALGIVKDFLHSKNCCIKKFMIDKCETERAAIKAVGGSIILCEFHCQKLISSKLKNAKNYAVTIITIIKKIQRQQGEMDKNLSELNSVCHSAGLDQFYRWFQREFIDDWFLEWSDLGRESRSGLNNTNNASEAFFKTLLRGFLKGITTYSPAELLNIIQDEVIPVLEYKSTFSSTRNPSYKKNKKYQQKCEKLLLDDKIVQLKRNLFSVETAKGVFQVNCYKETRTCSCMHFLWDGKCFHEFCVGHILKPNSGFFFTFDPDEIERENTSTALELLGNFVFV